MLEATRTQANKTVCGDACSTVCYLRQLDSWVSKTSFLVKQLKISLKCPPSFPMGCFLCFSGDRVKPFAEDRCRLRDGDRQTAFRQTDFSAHNGQFTGRRQEEREEESPNLGWKPTGRKTVSTDFPEGNTNAFWGLRGYYRCTESDTRQDRGIPPGRSGNTCYSCPSIPSSCPGSHYQLILPLSFVQSTLGLKILSLLSATVIPTTILALRKLRQEDCHNYFKASVDYKARFYHSSSPQGEGGVVKKREKKARQPFNFPHAYSENHIKPRPALENCKTQQTASSPVFWVDDTAVSRALANILEVLDSTQLPQITKAKLTPLWGGLSTHDIW